MTQAIKRGLVAAGVLAVVGSANAAAVDVTALTADIALQIAPITAVGSAVLLVYVAVKAFKWVRSALS